MKILPLTEKSFQRALSAPGESGQGRMAQREALHLIKAARAGHASAQLALGKQYLFGGAGLPKNSASALYWLDRAAQQQERDAWVLIGSYIPFETATHAENIQTLSFWYERAFEAGVLQAGIVLAKLVFSNASLSKDINKRMIARHALQQAAEAGLAEAQWMLAQQYSNRTSAETDHAADEENSQAWRYWAERAASNGVEAARYSLVDYAWEKKDFALLLQWAELPAQALLQAAAHSSKVIGELTRRDIELLKRCACALTHSGVGRTDEVRSCWDVAAQAGDADAQLELGLLLAKMDRHGQRMPSLPGRVVYKRALRWLNAAGKQGLGDAWYVMSRIYLKPEFSQRSSELAQHYMQKAAESGHAQAQLEWGLLLWRRSGGDNDDDVQALDWLSRSAKQGNAEAQDWIARLAPASEVPLWAQEAGRRLNAERRRVYPYLAARIELAQRLGLTRAEALLLNIVQADRGHCLVVDIRAQHVRSKRRLIAIQDGPTRQLLDRIRHLFHDVDCSDWGPEGNYRRRLYRLKSLIAEEKGQVQAVPGIISRSRLQIPSLPVRSS